MLQMVPTVSGVQPLGRFNAQHNASIFSSAFLLDASEVVWLRLRLQ